MSPLMVTGASLLFATPAAAGTLVVRVENIASSTGELRVAVCERSFDEAGCQHGARRSAADGSNVFRFDDLPPGSYAVAVYHDLNGNGELDKIPPGLPTEPYGFSNAVGRFGPPSFERAVVRVDQGETDIVVSLGRLFGSG